MKHQLKKDLISFLEDTNKLWVHIAQKVVVKESNLKYCQNEIGTIERLLLELKSTLEYFPVTYVSREDITDKIISGTKIPEQGIEITDSEMERIADKMGDAYCEHNYWIDLEIIAENVLEDKLTSFKDMFKNEEITTNELDNI